MRCRLQRQNRRSHGTTRVGTGGISGGYPNRASVGTTPGIVEVPRPPSRLPPIDSGGQAVRPSEITVAGTSGGGSGAGSGGNNMLAALLLCGLPLLG
jgi:hypothetical protein